jgi:DNA-binding transcriptional MerR regulator
MSEYSTIAGAAAEVGVAANTLRVYEMQGLLKPIRDTSGRRLYTPADIKKAKSIKAERHQARRSSL